MDSIRDSAGFGKDRNLAFLILYRPDQQVRCGYSFWQESTILHVHIEYFHTECSVLNALMGVCTVLDIAGVTSEARDFEAGDHFTVFWKIIVCMMDQQLIPLVIQYVMIFHSHNCIFTYLQLVKRLTHVCENISPYCNISIIL